MEKNEINNKVKTLIENMENYSKTEIFPEKIKNGVNYYNYYQIYQIKNYDKSKKIFANDSLISKKYEESLKKSSKFLIQLLESEKNEKKN